MLDETNKQMSRAAAQLAKKQLKVPKGQSEAVNRRTYNTVAKRKMKKGQTTIYKIGTRCSIIKTFVLYCR